MKPGKKCRGSLTRAVQCSSWIVWSNAGRYVHLCLDVGGVFLWSEVRALSYILHYWSSWWEGLRVTNCFFSFENGCDLAHRWIQGLWCVLSKIRRKLDIQISSLPMGRGATNQLSKCLRFFLSYLKKKKKKLTWHHLHRCKYRKQVGVLNLLTYFLKPLLERILFTKRMRQWAEMWSSLSPSGRSEVSLKPYFHLLRFLALV